MQSIRFRFPVLLAAALVIVVVAAVVAFGPPALAAPIEAADLVPPGPHRDGVPTPASVLGFEVGERHVRHDQVVTYAKALAAASDRVVYSEQGRTHEGRVQPLLTISSPANLGRLDALLERHRAASEPPFDAEPADAPAIVWLGYSIHGDEASGANASLLVAYHLAASEGDEVAGLLSDVVVLIDPSLNPDGLDRFANWANMHHGEVSVGDRNHREHRQGWPGGRTNHYWFDLNRDWLPAQHPETRNRLATLRHWRPHLLADFHEMGTDSTYFFQPGVPSRQNPLTPAANLELTRQIASHHAAAFDRAGRLYYSEETFDDFYYGKGSTYPDVQGAIGILFEQASARGHLSDSDNGPLAFADAVQGHYLTSFSTLEAAQQKRRALLDYHADFFRHAAERAAGAEVAAYLFGDGNDPARAWHFLDLLAAHAIEVRALAQPVDAGGHRFRPGHAWVVPVEQRQSSLVEALFERRTEFADATFYDVSA
ncbi:MAG TPA: M14 metallopeptidase family protein, partial [Thermoanaerobaculia bacterium]|nr:M14 metallopeptidase family protein [Thermoanaerobaculia bacterium]